MEKSVVQINDSLEKLSKEFNLKYSLTWFNFIWITKRDEIILQYIGNCLDNIYDKYGNYPNGRISNISKFFANDLKKLSKRYGGEVYSKKQLEYQAKLINKIKDERIKKEILKLLKKIEKGMKSEQIALITKSNIKKEQKDILRILRHEWIHILLYKNNFYFAKHNKEFWKFDEGLCTYMESFLDGTINLLESQYSKIRYPYEKQYFWNAIKFKRLFREIENPIERRIKLNRFIKNETN